MHVAELGSLSKAADRMRIAQPALSRHIRLLEEELGARLFDRHGRGMVLTDAGREVLLRATRILTDLSEIRTCVVDVKDKITGKVVIGVPPTVGEILSVPLVHAIRSAHPDLEIRFVSAFSGYLLDWIQRSELDIAILYDPQLTKFVRSRPLFLESLVLVGPPASELSLNRATQFSRLANETMLLPNDRHGLRVVVEKCARDAGIVLKVDIEADSFYTLKDLVANGFGFTILPIAPIHQDIESGRLTAAPLIEPSPVRRLAISFPTDQPISRAAAFVADVLARIVSDLVERGMWAGHLIDFDGK